MFEQASAMQLPVAALLGLNLIPRGPSYTLVRLLESMQAPNMPISLYAPINRWPGRMPIQVRTGLSGNVGKQLRVPYRVIGKTLTQRAERRLIRDTVRDDRSLVFT